jgi:DNA-binding CsgD family transcriptional regulator
LLAGRKLAPPPRGPQPPLKPLSDSELRVLRYLPTHLSAPEIARELYVSPNTVKTHMRNLDGKLAIHTRADAVDRARAVGCSHPLVCERQSVPNPHRTEPYSKPLFGGSSVRDRSSRLQECSE